VKRWKVEIGYSDEEAGAAEADPRTARPGSGVVRGN